jgi:pimeloyl-ACP methyl ester carboxylesterase
MSLLRLSRTPLLLAVLLVCLSGCKVLGMRTMPLDDLKERFETADSHWMMVDGTNVHYRLEGNPSGPTLILLHGLLASLQTWDGWVDALKPHFRIVRIDLPGFGLTGPMASKDYSPEYAVKLVEMMRAQLDKKYGGFDKVHLIGNSLGGFISWYYATEHAEHVDKLVLIDPIAYGQHVPFIIRFGARPFFGWYAKHQTPRFIVKRNLRIVYGDSDRLTDETIDRYFDLLCREGNRESMVEYFRTLIKYNHDPRIEAAVKGVKAETLLMFGEKDRWVPPALIERWQQDVENLQVSVIESAGHIPMEELPEETVRIAYRFLTGGQELPEHADAVEEQGESAAPPALRALDEGGGESEGEPTAGGMNPRAENDNDWGASSAANENPAPSAPAPKPANRPKMADW